MDSITEELGAKDREEKSEKEILKLLNPNAWNVYIKNNIEIDIDKKYEELLLTVSNHTNEDLAKISTFRFYVVINRIKEQNKNQ